MKIRQLTALILIAVLIIFSCKSAPAEITDLPAVPQQAEEAPQVSENLNEIIRQLIETGLLSSMTRAIELIRGRDLGNSEFGRVMNGITALFIRLVYPDSMVRLPVLDLPQTHVYSRIIREAEKGSYIQPAETSGDFFEYVLPFLAVNNESNRQTLQRALNDLVKAAELKPQSVLPHFFRGIVYERLGEHEHAGNAYKQAYDISAECYPALIGYARMIRLSGKREEAAALFSDLIISHPDSIDIKKQLAVTYYENSDWSRAGTAIDEILQHEPRDGDFLLMRAHVSVEQGNFAQANAPLDTYASISAANANNRFYLFLRARVQAEGFKNRDSALNYLRSIIRSYPDDEDALIYAAHLLMESQRSADQSEGREYLNVLLKKSGSSIAVLSLGLRDAVNRENWRDAQGFLNRILSVRRDTQDLVDAYYIENGLGNNARALTYALELYNRDSSNNDYAAIYISALINNGRTEDASALLENRISAPGNGAVKSKYFYLRSRIHNNEDASLGDLRSSLFEDPRNLEAIIAMFEIYHRRREERRAVYYLRQALAIAPENPLLKRYEREYAAQLGRN
ncbi:MAG: tetratricopeptide repeat protein [Treponema sp.]|nr:tetratricopeptide repeat protein [Treponema sp.]